MGPGRNWGAVVNPWLLGALRQVAKVSERRGEDVGAGAALPRARWKLPL